MNTNAVGKYQWQETLNGWYLEMDANWDTRYIELLIKAHNSGLFQDFGRFSISRALLLSVILRYDNFNIRGKASVLSDELLRNPKSLSLLKKRKSRIKIEGKKFNYQAHVKRQDIRDVEQLFHSLYGLLNDIDELSINPRVK